VCPLGGESEIDAEGGYGRFGKNKGHGRQSQFGSLATRWWSAEAELMPSSLRATRVCH
jgi:hypothetical protein